MGRIIEKYNIEMDELTGEVEITENEEKEITYHIKILEPSQATSALLDEIRNSLITEVAITGTEILEHKALEELKKRFKQKADTIISELIPNVKPQTKKYLIGILLNKMLGLGEIEFLVDDPHLEEIVLLSSKESVRIYHKKYGWLKTNINIKTEEQIQNFSNIIARRVGRQITTLNPLLDAHLVTGDRVNALLYPVSYKGNTITIRKFARDPWTVTDFIENKTCSAEIFALIWLAVQYEMNILISGGTASGKTTMLNICMSFMPPNHRILSIEDTRELTLPSFLYWSPLVTRQPNPEGKGEVTMLDLLVNSLRMRPDRIILGEMRKKDQAEVLFEAMHTGHSVYATVHADSVGETITRLTNPPISVPKNLLSAVNLNVVMFRDRRKGIRRVYQIGEFLSSQEETQTSITPNLIYRWKPEIDQIVPHAKSLRFFENLSRHTGLSQKEINQDLKEKTNILNELVKKKIRSIEDIGKVINKYYLNTERVTEKKKIKK